MLARQEVQVRRQVPAWPHPVAGSSAVRQGLVLHPESLRYILQCEGDRLVAFLSIDDHSLLPLRVIARGYSLTVSSPWFRHLEVSAQQQLVLQADSSQTDSPWSSLEHNSSSSTDSPATATLPRVATARLPESSDVVGATATDVDPSVATLVRELEIGSLESWSDVLDEFQEMHQRLAMTVCQFGREVSMLAERGVVEPASLRVLGELTAQKEEVEWLLQLAEAERLEEAYAAVRAICLRQSQLEAQPLMHTRLLANQEVNENLGAWKAAMAAEFKSLVDKGAICEVSDSQVRSWIDAGEDVEVLPGRGVASEKPPEPPQMQPRKKYRAVICGNFQRYSERRESESLYAGGADSLSSRLALRFAGLRSWGASSTDVKTAFLNAKLDEAEPRYLICAPPRSMIQAGVVPPNTKWWVRGALYGLTTSPRAWGRHRDKTLRQTKWEAENAGRSLWQCLSDPNVWLILREGVKPIGILLCYVDDLLVLGPMPERAALLAHIASIWSCSPAVHSESGDLVYCGLEIASVPEGLFVSQSRYIRELLGRHDVGRASDNPCSAWKEAFDDAATRDEHPCPRLIRAAQSLVGELMWLSVRSRADIAFPVARAAQLATKRPGDSIAIGKMTLAYLKSSEGLGILFGKEPGTRGDFDQFPRAIVETSMHGFTDISFGPSAGRSHQGVVICWAGSPVYWESGRQSLTSLSTAEAELIGLVYGSQILEAVSVLAGELCQVPCVQSLFGDNAAALAIATGPPTSWRTRQQSLRRSATVMQIRETCHSGSGGSALSVW